MKKKTIPGRGTKKKLKLTKSTLKDLDAGSAKRNIRGGARGAPPGPIPIPYPETQGCSVDCSIVTCACGTKVSCLGCGIR